MKRKPDTDQFKLTDEISTFLDGGAADAADRENLHVPKDTSTIYTRQPKVHREQKVFRLPLDLINALKREAYERSVQTGNRVTETELVEEALRSMLNV